MCHLFLRLLCSRIRGLNFLGGVSACPNSAQGSHRKILAPTVETLIFSGRRQKPQRPVPIDSLNLLPLPFTDASKWRYHRRMLFEVAKTCKSVFMSALSTWKDVSYP